MKEKENVIFPKKEELSLWLEELAFAQGYLIRSDVILKNINELVIFLKRLKNLK